MKYPVYIKDPQKNKKVMCGYVEGKTYHRDVKPEHFMRVVGGYGIQEVIFQELLKIKTENIVLHPTMGGSKYESGIEDWLNHGKVADYGHGKQRFLSTSYMSHPE